MFSRGGRQLQRQVRVAKEKSSFDPEVPGRHQISLLQHFNKQPQTNQNKTETAELKRWNTAAADRVAVTLPQMCIHFPNFLLDQVASSAGAPFRRSGFIPWCKHRDDSKRQKKKPTMLIQTTVELVNAAAAALLAEQRRSTRRQTLAAATAEKAAIDQSFHPGASTELCYLPAGSNCFLNVFVHLPPPPPSSSPSLPRIHHC